MIFKNTPGFEKVKHALCPMPYDWSLSLLVLTASLISPLFLQHCLQLWSEHPLSVFMSG